MYKKFILNYIHLLTPNHIKEYAEKNKIYISDEETLIIYKFILNNYDKLLEDNQSIELLKPLIRGDLYDKIVILYKENKAKYID